MMKICNFTNFHCNKYFFFVVTLGLVIYFSLLGTFSSRPIESMVFKTTKLYKGDRNSSVACSSYKYVSVIPGGRLGNIVWEYMSIISVASLSGPNLQAVTPADMKSTLLNLFEHVKTKQIDEVVDDCTTLEGFKSRFQFINVSQKEIVPNPNIHSPIILAQYSARFNEIILYGFDRIRNELRFKKDLVRKASQRLSLIKNARGYFNKDVVFVGVHYRGDDYVPALQKFYTKFNPPPDYRYYIVAMNYFRAQYKNVLFIFVTIDQEWLNANIYYLMGPDLYVHPFSNNEGSQYEDMVMLAQCNHTIVNYGTYGATAALFAGGEVLGYDIGLQDDYRGYTLVSALANALPNWHLCNFTTCDSSKKKK